MADFGSTLGSAASTLVGFMADYGSVLADSGSILGNVASTVVGCRAYCGSTHGHSEFTFWTGTFAPGSGVGTV